MTKLLHINTAPVDGREIIVGGPGQPAWEHRVRWERNGWAIDRERFANPTWWRPCDDPPAPAVQGESIKLTDLTARLEHFAHGGMGDISKACAEAHNEIVRLRRELEEARAAFLRDQAVEKLTDELALARAALREIVSKSHYPDEGIARRALASAEQKP